MIGENITADYDFAVIGGGMAGVCMALASARHGAKTALIHNRPVLGGNASSEIRMHICGADNHANKPGLRETGIIEEILLEHKKRNSSNSFSMFDAILWEKVHFQDNLDLFLNTHIEHVTVENGQIKEISGNQQTTEKEFVFRARLFADCTGDGFISYLAGAEYMEGREGKDIFGEKYAPDESDSVTMGNSLMFKAVDTGAECPYQKPFWANTYDEADLKFRGHGDITSGYWWIELGGGEKNIISDGEEVRDELLKAVFGVWEHIKNRGDHNADNYALDWVGFLPGKRESRRVIGDYILKEQDLLSGKIFDDAVAYGGWPMDMHVPEGLASKSDEPTQYIHIDGAYTIPYRCLYSKNIANLFLGGRNISASRMAFGSTRVMATCAVSGQAAGVAAAIAVKEKILPRDIARYISELKKILVNDDCYIPGFVNENNADLAKNAKITASSEIKGGEAVNIANGIARSLENNSNCWISDGFSDDGEWLKLELDGSYKISEMILKFDSDLSKEIMISLSDHVISKQYKGAPPQLVKDYDLELLQNGEVKSVKKIRDNYLRLNKIKLDNILCDEIKIKILATNGDNAARIFEACVL